MRGSWSCRPTPLRAHRFSKRCRSRTSRSSSTSRRTGRTCSVIAVWHESWRWGGLKPASQTAKPPNRLTAQVDGVTVQLDDPEGAPRYMIAVIRGVKVQPSPPWLATRLQAIGQRSINNIVDATNYILFEVNQPLHAFDLAKLRGPAVVVRRAKPGEQIVTLDGVSRR